MVNQSAKIGVLTFVILACCLANAKPIVYPTKGQNAETQAKDEAECYAWAKQNTGIDPIAIAEGTGQTDSPGGERVKGAIRGAAGGALVGAVVGDASDGAAVGAVLGTMSGGHQARASNARQQQLHNTQQQSIETFYRAYGACMSGRGYAVN